MTDKLGDRMKEFYENRYRIFLPRRMPLIIRIDGKSFHSLTRGFKKPYDLIIRDCMTETAIALCEQIQGTKIAYIQSDEISLLVTDYDDIKTDAWFDKNIQKISSISASIATLAFNKEFYTKYIVSSSNQKFLEGKIFKALFDSRAFVLPKEEVVNYFIWRQNDASRNAVQGLGQENFSHKEIQGVNTSKLQEKLFTEKGLNFNDEPVFYKRGWSVKKVNVSISVENIQNNEIIRHKWEPDFNMPILTQERNYIEQYI
jgi:tRNA(His) 5'-end guanylyltransferase